MKNKRYAPVWALVLCLLCVNTHAQDADNNPDDTTGESVTDRAETIVNDTRERVDEIAERVDQSERAKEISAGILQPIYQLAEYLSFPAVHWVAFAIMTTGVISFALH